SEERSGEKVRSRCAAKFISAASRGRLGGIVATILPSCGRASLQGPPKIANGVIWLFCLSAPRAIALELRRRRHAFFLVRTQHFEPSPLEPRLIETHATTRPSWTGQEWMRLSGRGSS